MPNSYIIEQEVHNVPVPPPLDVPIPAEVVDLSAPEVTQHPWVKWLKAALKAL
jgi:hypothetical protein